MMNAMQRVPRVDNRSSGGLMRHVSHRRGFRLSSFLPVQELGSGAAAGLRLFIRSRPDTGSIYWKINGFRARLLVWTAEEWENLEVRPADAQFHPSGVWCALRIE